MTDRTRQWTLFKLGKFAVIWWSAPDWHIFRYSLQLCIPSGMLFINSRQPYLRPMSHRVIRESQGYRVW